MILVLFREISSCPETNWKVFSEQLLSDDIGMIKKNLCVEEAETLGRESLFKAISWVSSHAKASHKTPSDAL